ncbi:MAG: hypothetical protein P8074_26480 [Anaerolineales bacterium]
MKQKAIFLQAIFLLFVITFSLVLVYPARAAATIVAGEVSGTWYAAGSPYLVEGDITVPAGQTLRFLSKMHFPMGK